MFPKYDPKVHPTREELTSRAREQNRPHSAELPSQRSINGPLTEDLWSPNDELEDSEIGAAD
jgi:hypothetical protein